MTRFVDVLSSAPAPPARSQPRCLRGADYRVLVLERQKFPRFSIGESLLACSMELLEEAGMVEAVMARNFQFKNGAVFDRNGEHSEFNFAEKSSPGYPFTFQVPRADFDCDARRRSGAPGRGDPLRSGDHRRRLQRRQTDRHQPHRRRRDRTARAAFRARRLGLRPHAAQTTRPESPFRVSAARRDLHARPRSSPSRGLSTVRRSGSAFIRATRKCGRG